MSQKQAENEAREMSIAEKAKMNADDIHEEEAAEAVDPLAELYGETEIHVDLHADKWDLYLFLLHHSYASLSGLIGIALSLFCIGKGISEIVNGQTSTSTGVFLFIGVWFLIINPIMMLGKAAMQIKTNATLRKPITYIFTENGLIQQQGEVKVGCRWEQVTRVVKMKRIWVLYTGKMRGSILPVRQFGEHSEELMTLIGRRTGKERKANR